MCLARITLYFLLTTNIINIEAHCPKYIKCTTLTSCRYFMELLSGTEKPLQPEIVDFLRSQQCDFQNGYPKVCCKEIPTKFEPPSELPNTPTHLKKEIKPFSDIISPATLETERIRQKKIDELNRAFLNSDLLDFDFFRRRRKINSEMEVEIR